MNLENIPDQKKMTAGVYYSLIVLAGIFWLLWGLKFGVWRDIGLYAVLVVMIGFGLIGGFVYGKQS